MKEYLRPDAEIIRFAAAETIADEGGNASGDTTSSPWDEWSFGRRDDTDRDNR